jgi:hypothetical protein
MVFDCFFLDLEKAGVALTTDRQGEFLSLAPSD